MLVCSVLCCRKVRNRLVMVGWLGFRCRLEMNNVVMCVL